jgi:hypothetical protein
MKNSNLFASIAVILLNFFFLQRIALKVPFQPVVFYSIHGKTYVDQPRPHHGKNT